MTGRTNGGSWRGLVSRLSHRAFHGVRDRSRRGQAAGGIGFPTGASPRGSDYPGDFVGRSTVLYEPIDDPYADPGEIVWTRVAFEEDSRQGKDRPVLVVGRDGRWLLALMLSSKDHDSPPGPGAPEPRSDRVWLDLGTGDWDQRRRPSEVRIDRVLRIDPDRVRRVGACLDRERFDRVAAEVRRVDGWI